MATCLIISSTPSFTQRKPSAGERCDGDEEEYATAAEEGEELCMSASATERGGRPSRAESLPRPSVPLLNEELRLAERERERERGDRERERGGHDGVRTQRRQRRRGGDDFFYFVFRDGGDE